MVRDSAKHIAEPGKQVELTSSHEVMKLRKMAAVLPPLSLPKNVQLPRPTAMQRNERSVPLLSMKDRHHRGRVSAFQFFSVYATACPASLLGRTSS